MSPLSAPHPAVPRHPSPAVPTVSGLLSLTCNRSCLWLPENPALAEYNRVPFIYPNFSCLEVGLWKGAGSTSVAFAQKSGQLDWSLPHTPPPLSTGQNPSRDQQVRQRAGAMPFAGRSEAVTQRLFSWLLYLLCCTLSSPCTPGG